jgi:alcohol dehydrogenase
MWIRAGMTTEDAALRLLDEIETMTAKLGLPRTFTSLGIKPEDISTMAELAQEDICMLTNPCCYVKDEIEELYREVL